MLAEQVTIPEGTVKGPERVLPRNSVFNWSLLKERVFKDGAHYTLSATPMQLREPKLPQKFGSCLKLRLLKRDKRQGVIGIERNHQLVLG